MPIAKISPNQSPDDPPNQLARTITNRPRKPNRKIVFKVLVELRIISKISFSKKNVSIYLYRITPFFATAHP
jgi:hypothetical protein